MLERTPGLPSRYFFIRAVKKLARRFDAELYEGEESRLNKALPLVRTLMEGIDACMPERGESGPEADSDAAKEALKLLPSCMKLYDLVPSATPVFQIRAMEYQARMAPWSKHKTIVIEHADRMLDSSRNALLKILEEPPRQATFILTSSRRQALIPTVLSRVRAYRFVARTK
jgi:DNA polymerase-3 subunit gamma/tau